MIVTIVDGGSQIQSDPEGGIPSGSLEVLGRLEVVKSTMTL
jgi:hypothetical protein